MAGMAGCNFDGSGGEGDGEGEGVTPTGSDGSSSNSVNMRYAHTAGESTLMGETTNRIAQQIEDRSGGNISIDVFHGGELGTIPEMVQGVSGGSIDMVNVSLPALAGNNPDIAAVQVPGTFDSLEHATNAMNPRKSSAFKSLSDDLVSEADIRIVGTMALGFEHLALKSEVCSPSDLSGNRLRAPPIPIYKQIIQGLGGQPVEVDLSEVPTALASGTLDGVSLILDALNSLSVWDSTDYLHAIKHTIGNYGIEINNDVWNGLTDDQQEMIGEVVTEETLNHVDNLKEEEDEIVTNMTDEGMTLVDTNGCLQREAFIQSARETVFENNPEWEQLANDLAAPN
jgi:TRAP-type C4-dicarboxylate transport system substrate-binding protein